MEFFLEKRAFQEMLIVCNLKSFFVNSGVPRKWAMVGLETLLLLSLPLGGSPDLKLNLTCFS